MTVYGKHQPQKDWMKAGSFCLSLALGDPRGGNCCGPLVLCDPGEKPWSGHPHPWPSLSGEVLHSPSILKEETFSPPCTFR